MRTLAQGDVAMHLEPTPSDSASEDVEAAGSTRFATDVARRVSKTMRDLVPLSSADVVRWVDYWVLVVMFSQGERPDGV